MTFSGEVTAVEDDLVTVKVLGRNSLGDRVIATATLVLGSSRERSSLTMGGLMLSGKAAIVGIGGTDFSKNAVRSKLRLAAEAVLDALDDAGLTPSDVDGLTTFTMDSNTEVAVARAAGIAELKFFSKIHYGGGADRGGDQGSRLCCRVSRFQRAVRHAVRSGSDEADRNADSTGVDNSFSYPHGLSTLAAHVAMIAKTVHASIGCDQPGLRRDIGGRPQARRKEPQCVLLRKTDNH